MSEIEHDTTASDEGTPGIFCQDCHMPNISTHRITAEECERDMQQRFNSHCRNPAEHHPFNPPSDD